MLLSKEIISSSALLNKTKSLLLPKRVAKPNTVLLEVSLEFLKNKFYLMVNTTMNVKVDLLMLILLIPVSKLITLNSKTESPGVLTSLILITKIVMDMELIVLVLLELKLGVLLKKLVYGLLKS